LVLCLRRLRATTWKRAWARRMSSSGSSAAAGAAAISMAAVTCGAAAVAAVLLAQHERTEGRLTEAHRLLAQKEEQLQQAFRERTRLSDQLASERAARLDAERALAPGGAPAASPPAATTSASLAGGRNPDAPKPLALDPRMLGLVPSRSAASPGSGASPLASTTPGTGAGPDSPFHVVTPSNIAAPQSAAAELAELRQADVDGVVRFLHVRREPPRA
jgi:hypothetical protein